MITNDTDTATEGITDIDLEDAAGCKSAPQHQETASTSTTDSSRTSSSDKNDNDRGKLGLVDAICVLTTFATAGSVIVIPWTFGQLGYILGPIILTAVVLMGLYFFFFLLDVAATCNKGTCTTLGDVGFQLAGTKGRLLFDAFQVLNLVLYMPVALETAGLSIQYLAEGQCIGYYNIAAFAALFVMIQFVRGWNHVAWLSYVTLLIAMVKAYALLPYAFVAYEEDVVNSEARIGPIQAFVNPNPNWHDLAMAISSLFFAFAPIFILLEVRNDMRDPSQCKKALAISAGFQISMYIIPGIIAVALWGWDVSNPITLEIPRNWMGILMSSIVMLAVTLDYAMSAKIINDWIRDNWFPDSWRQALQSDSICTKFAGRVVYSLPTSALALGMVLAIPNFETLIGILTGITVVGASNWGITLMWELGGRKFQGSRVYMWIGCILGLLFTIWIVAAAVYQIATADYSADFFCTGT